MKNSPNEESAHGDLVGGVTLCRTDRLEALTVLRRGEYCIINTTGYDFWK
jgi:hypothetical protein